MTTSAHYNIHGVTLTVDAENLAVVQSLDRRMCSFRGEPTPSPDVRVRVGRDWVDPPVGRARPVYETPAAQVMYFQDSDELYVEYLDRVRLRCSPADGMIRLSWVTGDEEDVWLATHPLLTIALLEVLKRHSRHSVHAGCAAIEGNGVVLAGPSGAGKSTLAVGLARAGWEFLSDDLIFLRPGLGGVEVLGFPDEVDVTDHTLAMFPELAAAARAPRVAGRQKRSFRMEEALGCQPLARCLPVAVVMPRVSPYQRSRLVMLGAAEALVELAPNVLLTDAASAQAHLAVIGELVSTIPCFRLESGADIERVPFLLAELVR